MSIDPNALAPTWRRALAKLVDALVAGISYYGFRRILGDGPAYALAMGWLLCADASGSWGKALLRITVRDATTGFGIGFVQSLKRNAFMLPTIVRGSLALALSGSLSAFREQYPALRVVLGLAGSLWLLYEVQALSKSDDGRRPGDVWAGTRVVRLNPR